jgi:hypothetical protein
MSVTRRRAVRWGVLALSALATAGPATAQTDGIAQYRAALSKIFVWKYAAFPVFRQSALIPGTVLRVEDETIRLASSRCYPAQKAGPYRGITDYRDGMAISRSADLKITGDLLSKKVAEVEAAAKMGLTTTTSLLVSPLSANPFVRDLADLRKIARDPECDLILRLLDRKEGGYIIAFDVLHGVVRYQVGLEASAALTVAARAQLLATIAKTFGVKDADIGVGVQRVSFAVAASPAPQTLAIVPPGIPQGRARAHYRLPAGKEGRRPRNRG